MALTKPFTDAKRGIAAPDAIIRVVRVIIEPQRPYVEIKYAVYQDAAHAALAGAEPIETRDVPIVDVPERTEVTYADGEPIFSVVTEAKPDYTRLFGTEALDVKDANPIERAYAALKERPEFAGAVDVLEEPDALRI